MTRAIHRSLVVTVACGMLLWRAPAAPLAQQAPVFRSATSAVVVDVGVRDRSGRTVTGLTREDFIVRDNGVVQEVAEVSYGKAPIDVKVGLDVSYSVTGSLLDRLRQAVSQLMREMRKGDRLKLLLFNMRIVRAVDFTGDWSEVERAMRQVPAGGGTALFDAVSLAMVSASDPDRRQFAMFFTDGHDSSSTTPPATVFQAVERTNATVSFVVLSVTGAGPGQPQGFQRRSSVLVDHSLYRIASETGGAVTLATTNDLGLVFLRALEAFRTSYVLHYSPRGVEPGGFHTIAVEVARPGAVVQARRGYFGG
jgi:Ca-activated chloride channel homolog